MNVGSLFAGIGGFDLGLERAGMRTVWFVEQDEFCQAIIRKHWPDVPIYSDVREVTGATLRPVDVLCGGFPCQDLSVAGKGAGLSGARSGLWSEFARLIGELRPRYVIVENVPMLRSRGLGRVLGEMAEIGYDAEWDCIPAQAVGAPHRRDRIWIVGYPYGDDGGTGRSGRLDAVADPERKGLEGHGAVAGEPEVSEPRVDGPSTAHVADAGSVRRQRWPGEQGIGGDASIGGQARRHAGDRGGARGEDVADSDSVGWERSGAAWDGRSGDPDRRGGTVANPWAVEPDVGRVANGVPDVVDRLTALGNALVPQIAEAIGRRIVAYESASGR